MPFVEWSTRVLSLQHREGREKERHAIPQVQSEYVTEKEEEEEKKKTNDTR